MAVLNKHHGSIPADAIYIGRGSKWGNPYSHRQGTAAQFTVGSRDEACDMHEAYLQQQITNKQITIHDLAQLHGKDLVCFCAPQRCHGHTLERWAAQAHSHLYGYVDGE